ncbi:hypothetical protein SAMN04487970_106010 [Paenibacillus tianmuensis]|uniref:Apea-like HEPN domain-containing protein n=1 Tax=Paenibacillus tianmuensis TaxID=624147 RepID=A0A1G4TNZ7_9BACL|nr:hypothetical protein [Paenibacillus tianmuensis]SCW83140.1 hypothetical protein SAMN04487970_106010 [Paenibacillus tianmuensis]
MVNLVEEFSNELRHGGHLIVMPLSRILIEDECEIGKYRFYPIGEVDINALRPVDNNSLTLIENGEINDDDWMILNFGNEALREAATAITGAGPDMFKTNPLLAFTVNNLNWDEFLEATTHDYDKKILRVLTREAEKAMDLLKFYLCRADLIDTLPGTVGTWNGSNGFSSALLFNIDDYESYIIAGSVITHTVVKGIGLELGLNETESIREECEAILSTSGEVGTIVKTALAMHTTFLETNNPTTQFVKAMTLLEFLAYPDDFEKFENVRKQITPHIATDYNHYLNLKERFNELTGKKDETGKHIGYRTRIVHIGDDLEDILGDEMEVKQVMLEVQIYIGKVIVDMIKNHEMTWSEFEELRKQKKRSLGIV